ncbi:cupin domain-containing protein [Saccharopolyspora shandongensis]|uniref:cupin domain-containing protein n=1 Tax=Saccharopolyspora shandongensis TaxID=418495 RepID=UPI003425A729
MTQHDAFHPDLPNRVSEEQRRSLRTRLHHVRAVDLDNKTAQTEGMRRLAAISGDLVGSERIWMGETHVGPSTASDNHHHGESETAIYVVSGHPEFVFHDGTEEVRIKTEPGDYIFVPPFVPHREENPDPNDPAEVVIARSTQEAIVVNLPELYHLEPGES